MCTGGWVARRVQAASGAINGRSVEHLGGVTLGDQLVGAVLREARIVPKLLAECVKQLLSR